MVLNRAFRSGMRLPAGTTESGQAVTEGRSAGSLRVAAVLLEISEHGFHDRPRLRSRVVSIRLGRVAPVARIAGFDGPLAQFTQVGVLLLQIPADWDQVTELIEIVSEGKTNLQQDQNRLERFSTAC